MPINGHITSPAVLLKRNAIFLKLITKHEKIQVLPLISSTFLFRFFINTDYLTPLCINSQAHLLKVQTYNLRKPVTI